MLDLIVFEPDKQHCRAIREVYTAYSIKHNIDSQLREYNIIPREISFNDGFDSETAIYMLKSCQNIKGLAVSITKINLENYLILIAESLQDVLNCISTEFNPVGIIMKPVSYDAAEKIFDDVYRAHQKSDSDHVFKFKIRSREYSVSVSSILYFEASNKKMILKTLGQAYEFYMTTDEVLHNLPGNFIKIHKSYIVNTDHITVADFKEMSAELDDGSVIYISRTYKNELQEALNYRKNYKGECVK